MKNVLLVSYHFPPDREVGAFRCQKFAKYLPEFGWTPHVLTVKERHYRHRDPTRLSDVAAVRITRTGMLPSPLSGLVAARAGVLRTFGRSVAVPDGPEAGAGTPALEPESPGTGLRRLLVSLGRLPDDQIGWLPSAVASGLRICRRHDIRAIVSTSPPHTVHLVGLVLRRLTGIRWVADFRDPWVGNPGKPLSHRTVMSDRIDSRLERAVVRTADSVALLTERLRTSFLGRYPDEPANKFHSIYNGFDADDFSAVGAVSRNGAFTIAHVGSLYYRRSPRAFLTSVANLVGQGRIPRSDIRVVFVGTAGDGQQPDGGQSLGLLDIVQMTGDVSHREALAWMCRADLLCLFAQDQAEQIPAKAFEYLATGSPILAVTGDGATADLITKAGGTVVCDEPWAIEDAVYRQYLKHRAAPRPPAVDRPWTREEVRPYDRRVLTGQLATLLDDTT